MKKIKLILILLCNFSIVAMAQIPKPVDCSLGPINIITPRPDNILVSSVTITSTYVTGAQSYSLFYRPSNVGDNIAWDELPNCGQSCTVANLVPGGQYDFYMVASKTCTNTTPPTDVDSGSPVITIMLDPAPPIISSSNGEDLTESNSHTQLTAVGYSFAQYTWYRDGQVIIGATSSSITATLPGNYSMTGCGTFPDGGYGCQSTDSLQISGLHINYISTKIPLVENITDLTQLDGLSSSSVSVATVYSDGFARPIQSVARAASPLGNDMVAIHHYDGFGREPIQYAPFALSISDGAYHHVPYPSLPQLYNFYNKDNDKIANTAFPFAETLYEASPLNRVLQQGSVGEEWQLNATTPHVKSVAYLSNKDSDAVWVWAPSGQSLVASSFYAAGSLSVTESTDENSHMIREFKDMGDRTVLIEKVIEAGVKLRTYFVFDDMGRLTFVIPPKTVAALPATATVTIANTTLAKECYSYSYDERSRVIVKNIPGAGATYMAYDPWDRLVQAQTANQRVKNKWSFTKYDVFNRPIMNGEIVFVGNAVNAGQAIATFYANATVTANPTLRYEEAGSAIHGYTNRSYPVLANASQVYSASYFDDYSFLSQLGTNYQFNPEPSLNLTANSNATKGLLTGLKVIILGSSNYLNTVNFYDKKHQLIQVVTDNHLGGIDRSSNSIDFTGKILKVKMTHTGLQNITVEEEHTYDPQGRKQQVYHTVNGGSRILLCDYQYNELGQLTEKNIHSTDGNKFLQSLDYTYNIRGWLSQVNPSEVESNATYSDQYGFELAYTSAPSGGIIGFQPSFNGNITAFTERRPATIEAGGIFKNAYAFTYDYRDQLKQANYYQASNPIKNGYFDMSTITYDPNGNILSLQRKGTKADGTNGLIDNLNYFYNGNQLIKVDDLADQVKGFVNK